MCGACIDHLGASWAHRIDERHGLPGGLVGQAEHDEVDLTHQTGARVGVLALSGCDAPDLEPGYIGDAALDLQPRGAGLAIDEDRRLGPAFALTFGFTRSICFK